MLAALRGHEATVRLDQAGATALMLAAEEGHAAKIETLSIGDLRFLVASVPAEVGLREENAALRAENARTPG